MKASQDNGQTSSRLPAANPSALPASVNCDLCGWNMPLPDICREQRAVLGLLVCSQCVEDNLDARTDEPRAEVGLVGASH